MIDKLRVPAAAREEAVCRLARAIERTIRDLTDACPWPQRGTCDLDVPDALSLAQEAANHLAIKGAC